MRRSIAVAAAAALAALAASPGAAEDSAAPAGPSFALSGALTAEASASIENGSSVFSGLAAPDDSSASGRIDGKLSFSRGYAALGLLDFSYADSAAIGAGGATVESPSFAVNELYADLNFGDLIYLRLGKQRLSWGAGFVFNPSDPVNPPKDPRDSRSILEGVPAFKAELIADPVSLMAFAVLHDELDETGCGAKLSTSALPNSDVSASGYWSRAQSWTAALNASTAPLYEVPGWDSLQLWLEASAYGKGRYSAYAEGSGGSAATAEARGAQYALLCGASGQLPVLRTVLLAEYYHLSEGLSKGEIEAVYGALGSPDAAVSGASAAWYSELARRPGRLGRDYLFASLSQGSITESGDPVLDKVGLSASCLFSLTDLSAYLTGGISIGVVPDSSLDIDAHWAAGGAGSEFGNALERLALDLKLKVFF